MKRLAWLLIAVIVWLALAAAPAGAAERQFARHQGLTASIDSSFGCARQASITVRAPSEAAYSGDRLALQRLLATVRAGLSVECPMLSEIDVMGLAAGMPAFAATIAAANGWKLPSSVDRGLAGRTPTSPLAAKTSTCDYDPNQPLIGCWVIISPEHLRGIIANHRRGRSWYTDTPQNLAAGTVSAQGVFRTDYLVGVGPRVEFIYANEARSSWIGPYFAEECTILRLDPYYLLDNMMALGPLFGVPTSAASREPIYMVRLRSPLKINADILTDRSSDTGGLTGNPGDADIVEGMPSDGNAPLFNHCPENFDQDDGVLLDALLLAIPATRLPSLFSGRFSSRLAAIARRAPSKYARVLRSFESAALVTRPRWMQLQAQHAWEGRMESWTKRSINSASDLEVYIARVRNAPDMKKVLDPKTGRTAYGKYTDNKSGVVVTDNPIDTVNGGTAFPTRNIEKRFQDLK